jgi:uncharacterized membrane protein YkoI
MKFLCLLTAILAGTALAADPKETKVKTKDLPPAVQKGVERESKGAKLKGVSKEVENGKTLYEVETVAANGKTRDVMLDESGNLVVAEEEVPLSMIPAAARAAIQKEAAGWKIKKVEILKKDGAANTYEGHLSKGMTSKEVIVDADGKVQK